jgi:hypothetical protein
MSPFDTATQHFVRYWLSLSQTVSGWQLNENQAIMLWDEGSLQAHWLDGCRSDPVASNARSRDFDVAAADKRSAAGCSNETLNRPLSALVQ